MHIGRRSRGLGRDGGRGTWDRRAGLNGIVASVNRVLLLGIVDKEPELRFTPNGEANCLLTISTTVAGEIHRHRVHCQGRLGEAAGVHLHRGNMVYVEGRLRMHRWQDRHGQDHRRLEILGSDVEAVDPPSPLFDKLKGR